MFGFSGGIGFVDVVVCLMVVGFKYDICIEMFMVQFIVGSIVYIFDIVNNGKGSSEDGMGKGVLIIVFIVQGSGVDVMIDLMLMLCVGGYCNSYVNVGVVFVIVFVQNNCGEVCFELGYGQVFCIVLFNGKLGYGVLMVVCVVLWGWMQGFVVELGGSVVVVLCISGGGVDKFYVLVFDFEVYFCYDWNEFGVVDWL